MKNFPDYLETFFEIIPGQKIFFKKSIFFPDNLRILFWMWKMWIFVYFFFFFLFFFFFYFFFFLKKKKKKIIIIIIIMKEKIFERRKNFRMEREPQCPNYFFCREKIVVTFRTYFPFVNFSGRKKNTCQNRTRKFFPLH